MKHDPLRRDPQPVVPAHPPLPAAKPAPKPHPHPRVPPQTGASWGVAMAVVVVLVAALLDPPLREVARNLDPPLRALFLGLSRFGNSAWPLGLGAAVLAALPLIGRQETARARVALRRLQGCVWFLIASVAASGLAASGLKYAIGRARPSMQGADMLDFSAFAFHAAQASFPSGHATTAVAMMVALALIVPRFALGAVALGAAIALARALIGLHWLSDVVAGAALGTAVTLALHRRFDGGRRRPMLSPAMARLVRKAVLRAVSRGGTSVVTRALRALRRDQSRRRFARRAQARGPVTPS